MTKMNGATIQEKNNLLTDSSESSNFKTKKNDGAAWDSVFYTITKFTSLLLSIVIAKILSTFLTLDEYGTYSQGFTLNSVILSIILLGTPDTINFFYNKLNETKEKRVKYVNTIFLIELVCGVIAGIAILIFQDFICGYFNNDMLYKVLPFLAFMPLLQNILSLFTTLYISCGKAKYISIRNFIFSIVKILIIIFSLVVYHDYIMIFALLLLSDIIQIVIFYFGLAFSSDRIRVNPFDSYTHGVVNILKFGIPMGIYFFTNTLMRELDKLVIGYYESTSTLAIYSNSGKSLPFDVAVTAVSTILIPYVMRSISQGKYKTAIKLYSIYLKIGFLTVWPLCTIAIVLNGSLIPFLYSQSYLAGRVIFVIYIFEAMLRFMGFHIILTATGKSDILMFASIGSLGANLVLNVILYKMIGVVGPAIATIFITLIYVIVISKININILKCSLSDVISYKEILMIIFSLLLMAISGKLIDSVLMTIGANQYVSMIFSGAIMLFVFVVINCRRIKEGLKSLNEFKLS